MRNQLDGSLGWLAARLPVAGAALLRAHSR